MPKTWTHRKPCRLCNSRNVVPVLRFAFTPPESTFPKPEESPEAIEKIPLVLSVCEKCHLPQMLDVIDPGLLYKEYPHAAMSGPAVEAHFEEYAADAVTRGRLQKGDLVIDIGGGDGTLLRIFRKLGMKVVGVDPSAASAARAAADGIPHYRDFFSPGLANDIRDKHGPASLITANFVLGSIDNLHAVAAAVRFLLKREGLFYIEEPNLADMFEQNLFDLVHHERLSLLAATTMAPFFRSTLLHLIDASRRPFRHGTLRAIVQRSDGPHVVSPSLSSLMSGEEKFLAAPVDAMNALAARVEQVKRTLKDLVNAAKSKGQAVAGYGASARTVTMVHECGWEKGTLDFIVDDDAAKHGLCLPGTSIPVLDSGQLTARKPAVVVVFAHNFADEIVRRHAGFSQAGGKFITIFPMPKVM